MKNAGWRLLSAAFAASAFSAIAEDAISSPAENQQDWNLHVQNTDIVQGYPGFSSQYSGPNSLPSGGETRETVSLDLMAGIRLWPGAEAHVDGLMWQGYGLGNALGVDGFPNGEAFRLGTGVPNGAITRLFIRQTIGLGGEQETIEDDQLTLAGKEDISRLTFTLGRFSAKDIFDNNAYANDPRTQFMNWAFMANEAWDYPADALGYITGFAAELNQPGWAVRYGFFQMPAEKNGFSAEDQFLMSPPAGADGRFLRAWAMMTELERRWSINGHPGAVRFLAWLNEADMASYSAATGILLADGPGADISPARAYRYKYGFGLNWEQEIAKHIGLFSRLGWNDGHEEAWTFTDANWTSSLGLNVNGAIWRRPEDTFGLAGVASGASSANQKFLKAGGLDMLDGDGALTYGSEKVLETYYDAKIWKMFHAALDYQFISNPAFNQDRGPVSIFGARLHWEF